MDNPRPINSLKSIDIGFNLISTQTPVLITKGVSGIWRYDGGEIDLDNIDKQEYLIFKLKEAGYNVKSND